MVNLKPFLAVLNIIKNLNTLSPSYILGLVVYSIVLSIIVNLKSPLVKDVGIGI